MANRPNLNWFSDEYCPHCDNHFVIEAATPKPALNVEGEDARVDARLATLTLLGSILKMIKLTLCRMLKDERIKPDEERRIFDVKEAPNKLG